MFQTAINHYLQNFDSNFFQHFMLIISAFGQIKIYLFFIFLLLFSIDFKKGFIALQCLLWANFITVWLKDLINFPRPFQVDSTLKLFNDVGNNIRLEHADAPTFFSSLPTDTLKQLRVSSFDPGFPSGHTSTATAFWGSLSVLSKRKWAIVTAVLFVFLTMLSRLYLGMHFLADVMGGFTIGLIIIIIILGIFNNKKIISEWIVKEWYKNKYWYIAIFSPLLLLLLPKSNFSMVGQIMGLNVGVLVVCKKQFPNSKAPIWKRALRFVIAVCLYILIDIVSKKIFTNSNNDILNFAKSFISIFLLISLAIFIETKTKLFEKETITSEHYNVI